MYAYVILDPTKKLKDSNKLLSEYLDQTEKNNIEHKLQSCGIFILISKTQLAHNDVLPTYYIRQSIEQLFGFAKTNNLLPLRVHSNEAIQGYLLLMFIAIVVFIQIRNKLQLKFTVEQALLITRALKAKIYDKEIIPLEQTKKMKDIYSLLKITVPTNLGI